MSGPPLLAEDDGRNSFMPRGRGTALGPTQMCNVPICTHDVFVVMLTDGLDQFPKT